MHQSTISSKKISKITGQTHGKVLRKIRRLIPTIKNFNKKHYGKIKIHYFIPSKYKDRLNRSQPCYKVTKVGCDFYAASNHWDVDRATRIINAFHRYFRKNSSNSANYATSTKARSQAKNINFTMSDSYAQYEKYIMDTPMNEKQAYYILTQLNYMNIDGTPTTKADQSGLTYRLTHVGMQLDDARNREMVQRNQSKITIQDQDYASLLCKDILLLSYYIKKHMPKDKRIIKALEHLSNKVNSGQNYSGEYSAHELFLLLFFGYRIKHWGQKNVVDYQVDELVKDFNTIFQSNATTIGTDRALDLLSKIMHLKNVQQLVQLI